MTTFRNHFETGTNGLAITVANSTNSTAADNDALHSVFPNSGTITYSNAAAMHGSFSAKISGATGSTSLLSLGTFGTATTFASRCYGRFTGLPSVPVMFMDNYNSTAVLSTQQFNYMPDGSVQVARWSGAVNTSVANLLTLNHWYRFEMVTVFGTSGYQKWGVFDGDGSTAVFEYNTGTIDTSAYNQIQQVRVGKGTSAPTWGDTYFDDVVGNDAATGYIGILVPPPVAATTITTGVALINATGSTPGQGGTLSYAISPTTNTTLVSPGIWTAVRQATPVTYTITVTESGTGRTALSTVVVPPVSSNMIQRVFNGTDWVSS